jgi:hypothetical protein
MSRAKKNRCNTCHRVIPVGGSCPLAPHMLFSTGRVVRPIRQKLVAAIGDPDEPGAVAIEYTDRAFTSFERMGERLSAGLRRW